MALCKKNVLVSFCTRFLFSFSYISIWGSLKAVYFMFSCWEPCPQLVFCLELNTLDTPFKSAFLSFFFTNGQKTYTIVIFPIYSFNFNFVF